MEQEEKNELDHAEVIRMEDDPCRFQVGDIQVTVTYNEDGPTMEECLKSFLENYLDTEVT